MSRIFQTSGFVIKRVLPQFAGGRRLQFGVSPLDAGVQPFIVNCWYGTVTYTKNLVASDQVDYNPTGLGPPTTMAYAVQKRTRITIAGHVVKTFDWVPDRLVSPRPPSTANNWPTTKTTVGGDDFWDNLNDALPKLYTLFPPLPS